MVSGAAETSSAARVGRPLYSDMSTHADETALPASLVEAMAGETLSDTQRAVIDLDLGQAAPDGVQVLRVMVLVSDHQDDTGAVVAATAHTSLLTTLQEGQTVGALYYQSLQQKLTTASHADVAVATLRARFEADLAKRVRDALAALPR